jgi:hypothetical protein
MSQMEVQMPHLRVDHTHFSNAKPDFEPGYVPDRSVLDAFLRWPADALRSV